MKKDKKDDDDDDDDKPKKKSKPFTCKKAKCDPGETKLDKPNIYGACCQVGAAPLTPKTTPDAPVPEKCKFPGEVGTPPNCKCPEGDAHSGYEFLGYKGCVRFTYATACGTGPITPQSETAWTKREESECKAKTGVVSFTCSYPGPGEKKCCCKRKVF